MYLHSTSGANLAHWLITTATKKYNNKNTTILIIYLFIYISFPL